MTMLLGRALFGLVGVGIVIGGALLVVSLVVLAAALVLRAGELAFAVLGYPALSERAAAMRRRVMALVPKSAPMPRRKGPVMPGLPPI